MGLIDLTNSIAIVISTRDIPNSRYIKMEKITSKRAPKFLLKTKKVIKNLEVRKSPKLIFGEVFNIVNTIDYFLLLLR